jgi:hypothetical protein
MAGVGLLMAAVALQVEAVARDMVMVDGLARHIRKIIFNTLTTLVQR